MQKALLLLSIIASAAVAKPQEPTPAPTWTEIHSYIVANSNSYSSSTEAVLYAESSTGKKTWSLSGGGLGWPQNSDVIGFPTNAQAQHLGNMIDRYRTAQSD